MSLILNNAHLDYEADTNNNFTFTKDGLRLLVDADPIAYLAASACETHIHHIKLLGKSIYSIQGGKTELYSALEFENKSQFEAMLEKNPNLSYEIESRTDNKKNMKHTIKRQVAKLIERTGAGSVELYLTDSKSNFRLTEDIATILKYKGNRSSDSKPVLLKEARDYLLEELNAIMCFGMEADDKLAIEHRRAWKQAMEDARDWYVGEIPTNEMLEKKAMELTSTVLASIDKDLKQVAGKYINPDEDLGIEDIFPLGHLFLQEKGSSKKLRFNGLKAFYAQLIMGDSADAIPSVYFCGDARVFEVLNECKDEEELFKAALRETYEGFHREMIKSFDSILNEKVESALLTGLHGNDNKSNRGKLRKKFKDYLVLNTSYKDKHYYHWNCFVENADSTTSKVLKEGVSQEDVITISPIDHMTEVAQLVYMLDKEPCEDDSHLWTPPNEQWIKDVQDEYTEKNLFRVNMEWIV